MNGRDFNGRTPLHLAALSSTVEIVQCLLDHRAQLTATLEDGKNAIHLACIRGHVEILSLLLGKSKDNQTQWLRPNDDRESLGIDLDDLVLSDGGGEADPMGRRRVAAETQAMSSQNLLLR